MKNASWLSLGLVAFALVACDPYTKSAGGTPKIVDVVSSNEGLFKTATLTGSTYSVNTVCTDTTADPPAPTSVPVIWVTFDRLLGGSQVQTSTADCTPAGGWLTVTPAAPTGFAWFTCYNPASPANYYGGQIVIYLAPTGPSSGWADAVDIPADLGTITMTGSVNGAELNLSVNPADAGVDCG